MSLGRALARWTRLPHGRASPTEHTSASLADLQTVSSGGLQVDSPDWSFDGKKILFTAAGIWDLYTINLDGTGLAKVVTPGGEQENYASFKPGP